MRRAFSAVIGVLLLLSPGSVRAGATPPGYETARAVFLQLDEYQRVRLQIILTAAGFWPAVPNKSFSDRLFSAIVKFSFAFAAKRNLAEEGPAFQASSPKNFQAGLRISLFF